MSDNIPPRQLEFNFGEDDAKEQVEIKNEQQFQQSEKTQRELEAPYQLPLPLFDDN